MGEAFRCSLSVVRKRFRANTAWIRIPKGLEGEESLSSVCGLKANHKVLMELIVYLGWSKVSVTKLEKTASQTVSCKRVF